MSSLSGRIFILNILPEYSCFMYGWIVCSWGGSEGSLHWGGTYIGFYIDEVKSICIDPHQHRKLGLPRHLPFDLYKQSSM